MAAVETAGAGRAYVFGPGESELRCMGETRSHFLATGAMTGGAFCLVDEHARKGETVPLHRHPADMEAFYVLQGEIRLFVGNEPGRILAPGGFAHVPAGTVHGFRVESETARYLLFTTAHHGEFYRAITVPARPGSEPPPDAVTSDMIAEACERYGIELIGPLPD